MSENKRMIVFLVTELECSFIVGRKRCVIVYDKNKINDNLYICVHIIKIDLSLNIKMARMHVRTRKRLDSSDNRRTKPWSPLDGGQCRFLAKVNYCKIDPIYPVFGMLPI